MVVWRSPMPLEFLISALVTLLVVVDPIGLVRAAKAHALLEGRAYVTPHDVKAVALDVLRHRVIPTYEAEAEGLTSEAILRRTLDAVPVP